MAAAGKAERQPRAETAIATEDEDAAQEMRSAWST
jgi:hypothetical protein